MTFTTASLVNLHEQSDNEHLYLIFALLLEFFSLCSFVQEVDVVPHSLASFKPV